MTGYPAGDLGARAELLLGGVWTDVTPWAMPDGMQYADISGGQPDGAQQPSPMSLPMTWDNPDGKFSPRNAMGPWFGQLRMNTPARVSVASPYGNYLRIEDDHVSYASCPSTAALQITGDTDVRLDLGPSSYANAALCGRNNGGTGPSWLLLLEADGTLFFDWWDSGGTVHFVQSTAPVPYGRIVLRATLAVATGTVTFWTAAAGNITSGPWTQLGAAASGTGGAPTSVFGGTASLYVGDDRIAAYGAYYGFQLRGGIGGTVVAGPDFTAQSAGAPSFGDGYGNTWTLAGTAEISDRDYRLHGELGSIVPAVDKSGGAARVAATISGPLRRLQQGNEPPVDSPMRRAVLAQSGALTPFWYVPGEDSAGARQLGAALGGAPMIFDGAPSLAADTSFACSAPLVTLNGSRMHAKVPAYTAPVPASVIFRSLAKVGSVPASGSQVLVRLATTGTCHAVELRVYNGGGLGLAGYDPGGAQLFSTGGIAFGVTAQPLWYSIELQPSGSTLDYSIVTLAPGAATGSSYAGSIANRYIGHLTDVWVNPSAWFTDTVIGHFSGQSSWGSLFNLASPLNAWQGEKAGNRFARLGGENGYDVRIYGAPDTSAAMGPQGIDTLFNLLNDCAQSDQGLTYEPREALALGYRTLASMLHQSPALTLSYAAANLPGDVSPAEDDLNLVNDATVIRPDGSSARSVLDDGSPKSVSAPKDGGAGRYATTFQTNVQTDSQLQDAAAWRQRAGTVDEARVRQVTADFGIPGAPAADAARVRPGDLIVTAAPPATLQTGDIRQIATGSEELLGPGRRIIWACTPAAAYDVAVYDDPVWGRCDTAGSALVSAHGPTDEVLRVSVATLPWTTAGADFPFDIDINGEQITVINIDGRPSNFLTGQTATLDGGQGTWVGGVNAGNAPITTPVHSGSGAMALTCTTAGNIAAKSNSNANYAAGLPCTPGDTIFCAAWLRPASVPRVVQLGATFYTATGTPIGVTLSTQMTTEVTGQYVKCPGQITAPSTSAYCHLWPQVNGAALGEVHYLDDPYIGGPGGPGTAGLQSLTVIRAVNGVAKNQPAGAAVRLWNTPRYAPI